MSVRALHHYTIRCTPEQLPQLLDFYTRVVRLQVGDRPAIPAPGAWLYAQGQPIVHLFAHLSQGSEQATGCVDHIAFRSHDLVEMRSHLAREGVPYTEMPIDGWGIHQLFLRDPLGLKIELTFWLHEEPAA